MVSLDSFQAVLLSRPEEGVLVAVDCDSVLLSTSEEVVFEVIECEAKDETTFFPLRGTTREEADAFVELIPLPAEPDVEEKDEVVLDESSGDQSVAFTSLIASSSSFARLSASLSRSRSDSSRSNGSSEVVLKFKQMFAFFFKHIYEQKNRFIFR